LPISALYQEYTVFVELYSRFLRPFDTWDPRIFPKIPGLYCTNCFLLKIEKRSLHKTQCYFVKRFQLSFATNRQHLIEEKSKHDFSDLEDVVFGKPWCFPQSLQKGNL
jgi:hypothetical protein